MELADYFQLSVFKDEFWVCLFGGGIFILFIVSQLLKQSRKNLTFCIEAAKKELANDPSIFSGASLPNYIQIINSFLVHSNQLRSVLPVFSLLLFSILLCVFGGLAEINADGSSTPLDITTASLSATATVVANGLLLGELDIVSFTMFINQLEDYNIDVYRNFVKELNVARTKAISTSIEQTKITGINIDKILETGLEK